MLKPIRSEADYEANCLALRLYGRRTGTPEGDELEILASADQALQDNRFPIGAPHSPRCNRFAWSRRICRPRDLEPYMAESSRLRGPKRARALSIRHDPRTQSGLGNSGRDSYPVRPRHPGEGR